MIVRSDWLTAVRIERLCRVLDAVVSFPSNRVRVTDLTTTVWRKCGGPFAELSLLISVLVKLKLLWVDGDLIRPTKSGVALARGQSSSRIVGEILIRRGFFHDQARLLRESAVADADGTLRCPVTTARTLAPQLVGVLQRWPDVTVYPEIALPRVVADVISGITTVLPPVAEVPKWIEDQKAVGNRAEAYSLQFESTRVPFSLLTWTSQDSDRFGYDIEDRSQQPSRLIEVKGKRDQSILFYLSENQLKRATIARNRYEVHFWGNIDLSMDPEVEYQHLRDSGYPLVIRDIIANIGVEWRLEPVEWRVTPIVHSPAPLSSFV